MTRAQLDQDNSADGGIFILLYNITVQASLDCIVAYRDDVLRSRDKEGFRVLVIGIHCPADYHLPTIEGGELLAMSMGGTFMEMGVDDRNAISSAVNSLIQGMRLMSPEPESGSSRTQTVTYERNAGLRTTERESLGSSILSAESQAMWNPRPDTSHRTSKTLPATPAAVTTWLETRLDTTRKFRSGISWLFGESGLQQEKSRENNQVDGDGN
jgi:hypothetical protein